ncbi:hypothetical protein ACFB49_14970 [Sphingomonas sp. DBB INV C78]|uniref:EthD domain-containing protein n=1 Tax=Sphingomonas sp. DBB INV C78 TaxID=3349434 RepID=UPI0036D43457
MLKSFAFMPRRVDSSRADFRTYYETRHTPLALEYFRFQKYIRNHLADDQEPGFDCLSEFWHGDPTVAAKTMAGPAGEVLRVDERKFTDQSNIRAAVAESSLLSGPQRDYQPGATPKTLWLLSGSDRPALLNAATAAAAGRTDRVMLDLLSPFDERPIPCDAILSVWGADDFAFTPPPGWSLRHRLPVLAEETAPEILARSPQPAV